MNSKSLIILTIVLALSFILVIGGILALYKYEPTMLGLPPNPEDTLKSKQVEYIEPEILDTFYVEPRVELSVAEFDSYQSQLIKNVIMKNFSAALKTGIIKRINILNINFGNEAPYIQSIRLLEAQELEALTKQKHAVQQEIEDLYSNEEARILLGGMVADEESDQKINSSLGMHANTTKLTKLINNI